MNASGAAQIIIAMTIWGSVGLFVRLADQPSYIIVFFRVLSAFILLGLYTIASRKQVALPRGRDLALLIFSGLAIAINWLLFFKALQLTTIANAVLSYYSAPVLATLWAWLWLKEQLNRRSIVAMAVAVAGIVLLLVTEGFALGGNDLLGILAGLGGALFYSIVVVLVKRLSNIPTELIVVSQMGIAGICFLPLAIIHGVSGISLFSLLMMVAMGGIHSAAALMLYFNGLKKVPIQTAGVLSFIDPASALLFGLLFFGEVPSLSAIIGGVMILVAGYIVTKN